ncbi:pilin, partial [Pseudomonas fluorescens]
GLKDSTNCTITTTQAATGDGTIKCVVLNNIAAKGNITWSRDAAGAWTCAYSGDAKYASKGCPGPAAPPAE